MCPGTMSLVLAAGLVTQEPLYGPQKAAQGSPVPTPKPVRLISR